MKRDYYSKSYWSVFMSPWVSSRAYIVSVLPTVYPETSLIVYRFKNIKKHWAYSSCYDFEFDAMIEARKKLRNEKATFKTD